MTYRFLDNIAIADVAFEARGKTKADMFKAAAEATMKVMVEMGYIPHSCAFRRVFVFGQHSAARRIPNTGFSGSSIRDRPY